MYWSFSKNKSHFTICFIASKSIRMLPRIGLIVLAVPILPLTSVTCQETLNLFKDAMDSSLLSKIHDFIAYRNTKGCVAIFDVASDLTGSMILYYQIQHMKFQFSPVNFRKVLDVELSHDRIRHGTMRVDEHRNEILIDTLVSEMDRIIPICTWRCVIKRLR